MSSCLPAKRLTAGPNDSPGSQKARRLFLSHLSFNNRFCVAVCDWMIYAGHVTGQPCDVQEDCADDMDCVGFPGNQSCTCSLGFVGTLEGSCGELFMGIMLIIRTG